MSEKEVVIWHWTSSDVWARRKLLSGIQCPQQLLKATFLYRVNRKRFFLATKYITASLSFFHFAPFCSYVWTIIINCCFLYEKACKYTPTRYQFNTTIQLYTGVLPPVLRTPFSWLQWLHSWLLISSPLMWLPLIFPRSTSWRSDPLQLFLTSTEQTQIL